MPCKCGPIGSYIPPAEAQARIQHFQTTKFSILDNWVKFKHPGRSEESAFLFKIDHFYDLLNEIQKIAGVQKVKIYFASYKKSGAATADLIPADKDDSLTLIFAPTDDAGVEEGHYFNVDLTETTTKPYIKSLPKTVASDWVRHYQDNKLFLLQADVRRTAPNFGETKSTSYFLNDLKDWKCVIDCSQAGGLPARVSHIQFTLASYPAATKYQFQLSFVVQMVGTGSDGKHFVINVEPDGLFDPDFTNWRRFDDYDTGSPCPPTPGCEANNALPSDT